MTDVLFDAPGRDVAAHAPGGGAGRSDAATGEGVTDGRPAPTSSGPRVGLVMEVRVVGLPAPQGSKKAFVNRRTGRAVVVDDNKPRLRTWRDDVKNAALDARSDEQSWTPYIDALEVDITFLMPRPRGHYRTGRNAHLLRDSAPGRPTTKPDVDKLLRGCLDALKDAGIYRDDAQVVDLAGRKIYAAAETGAVICIYLTGDHA